MSPITSQTKFRRFNFTENENPERLQELISKHFQSSKNPFKYVKFQLERAPETGRKHAQGVVFFNNQLRVGKYVPRQRSKYD